MSLTLRHKHLAVKIADYPGSGKQKLFRIIKRLFQFYTMDEQDTLLRDLIAAGMVQEVKKGYGYQYFKIKKEGA